jgi:4-amino-4-deoxy-L-arabinose transferase-like glycosyltransferase
MTVATSDQSIAGVRREWLIFAVAAGIIALSLLTLAFTQTPGPGVVWPRWLAIMVLGWWLPGALLVLLWRLPDLDAPTAIILALGVGLCWMILLTLGVHWFPGPMGGWPLALTFAGGGLLLAAGLLWRPPLPVRSVDRRTWGWLAALLILAAFLRLPGLAYHEFHYDEVLVLTRAKEAIRGEDDAFARHAKGPGELAVATVVYDALGMANEGTARLPFALASIGSVLALALLAREMFWESSGSAGFWAGALLAFNGFALGLSRIVQYQGAILLLMTLAMLAGWRFARSGRARWLALSGLLSAFGLVLHYEFGLVAPALVWLAWLGWRRAGERGAGGRADALKTLAFTGIAGALLVGAAYLPILLNPYAATTQNYLDTRMGSLGRTFNGAFFVEMGTFYNSIYFFAGLIGLMLAGLFVGWRWSRRATIVLVLWFTPFLILYLFIVQFPGTHFYLLMPAWSILAALPLAWVTSRARPAWLRYAGLGGIALWLAVSGYYLYLMFFRQNPEYLINYADERVPFYWAPYGEQVPEKPRFGFPIREGWKTLGVLSEWKYLNGSYASNERSRHLRWYLGDFDRVPFDENPDFIFVARHLQEPDPAFSQERLAGYVQVGEVRVRGEPRIAIWSREPLPVPYAVYDAENFTGVFDGVGPTFSEWPDPAPSVTEIALDERITLVQGGVSPHKVRRGETLHVYLVWRAEQLLDRDYKLFVHLADAEGRPVAQWDGLPGLNTARTSEWRADEPFDDHVLMTIPPAVAPGDYQVLVGLYDGESGQRVGDKAVDLGQVTVR